MLFVFFVVVIGTSSKIINSCRAIDLVLFYLDISVIRKHIGNFKQYQRICAKLIPEEDQHFETVIKRLKQSLGTLR